jgi:hypothetical protein
VRYGTSRRNARTLREPDTTVRDLMWNGLSSVSTGIVVMCLFVGVCGAGLGAGQFLPLPR